MDSQHDIYVIFLIGMSTVLLVLGLVVLLGQLVIKLTNLFSAEENKEERIIKEVVSKITEGKGELISFESITKTK
jgi:Na+-transporting methylmalonyl-CoA/oxaloacetate decarboxylase gamma subunit